MPILVGDVDPHIHKSVVVSEFHDSCQFNEATDGPDTKRHELRRPL